jgi:UDP-GlcNAc:undecaprenyl-phosphate GlcNAc-1-phosphate transferase
VNTAINLGSCALLAFVVTVLAILALRPVAFSIDLVDRPGGRKTHHGVVPLVGGLAIFMGLVAALAFVFPPAPETLPLMGVFALMVVTGMLDDRFSLSPWMRLVVQSIAGLVLVGTTGAVVRTLGDPFGLGPLTLGMGAGVAFTLVAITAAVNSFNMMDGMDGLAAVVAVTSLAGLTGLSLMAGHSGVEVSVAAVLGAATLGFMVFNCPVQANRGVRCFMGDAGSMLIGVAVAWICVRVSQMPLHGVQHPMAVLWMVALPFYELLWTVIRRARKGHSPLHADAGHFHHLLTQGGLSVRAAFLAFLLLDVLLVGAGLLLTALQTPDWLMLVLLLLVGTVVVRTMHFADRIVRWLPTTARGDGKTSEA